MSLVSDLITEMQSNGLVCNKPVVFDNKFLRFPVSKNDHDNCGWVVGKEVPWVSDPSKRLLLASYGNWKTGEKYTFKNNLRGMKKEDKAHLEAELKKQEVEFEIRKKEEHDRAAKDAVELLHSWRKGRWFPVYAKRKKIKELYGAKPGIDDEGEYLCVPMQNREGEIRNVQKIHNDKKRFLFGGEKKGCFHVLRSGEGATYIAEGFATAATIAEAMPDGSVVCAFDAGNLLSVANIIRSNDANAPIVICADNDESGVGQEKGAEAAKSILGTLRICPEPGCDFNDIGVEATREFLGGEDVIKVSSSEVVIGGFAKINASDSMQVLNACTGKIVFDASYENWYRYDTTWEKCSEYDVHKIMMAMMDRATNFGWQIRDYDSLFKASKRRLARTQRWNHDKNLLPFKNGVLNLTTMELAPHRFDDFFNWHLPYGYDPTAKCPVAEKFMQDLSEGDSGVEDILWCYLAAIVRGRSDLQRYLELIGQPRTGKSTYITLASELVGKNNFTSTSMKDLENRFETANFFGKRLVTFMDAKSFSNSADVFKSLTGQDALRYEEKQKQATSPFIYEGMVLIGANEAIKFGDNSTAISRRRITVYVDKKLQSVDEMINEKLKTEVPGIINKILEIPNDWISSVLKAATGETSEDHARALVETSPIAAWIDECCVLDPEAESKVGKRDQTLTGEFRDAHIHLYPSYLKWAKETGRKDLSLMSFGTSLTDIVRRWDVEKKKTREGILYKGLRIKRTGDSQGSPFLVNTCEH